LVHLPLANSAVISINIGGTILATSH
jgi:hypothetical protein